MLIERHVLFVNLPMDILFEAENGIHNLQKGNQKNWGRAQGVDQSKSKNKKG